MSRRDLLAIVAAAALIGASLTFFGRSAANERVRPVACPQEKAQRTPAGKLPTYPDAESVGWESVSLEGGGGGFGDVQATNDDPEKVARWFACRLGVPETGTSSWSWHRRHESPGGRTITVVEVATYDQAQLPHFAGPVPEGTRTVIEINSFFTPRPDRWRPRATPSAP